MMRYEDFVNQEARLNVTEARVHSTGVLVTRENIGIDLWCMYAGCEGQRREMERHASRSGQHGVYMP
jgi:hypothetical protein